MKTNHELLKDLKENYENFDAKHFADKHKVALTTIYGYASKLKVSSNQRWDQYKEQIIQDYLNDVPLKEIGRKFGHFKGNIKKKLKEWGVLIKTQSQANRKISVNENFFEKIDSHEKAYFLGFIYADGNVYLKKEASKYVFQICLHQKDGYILESFRKLIQSEHKLYTEKRGHIRFMINSIKITEDLKKLGVLPKKSFTLDFPTVDMVPEKYINSFLLGYFDGDGSVFISQKDHKYLTIKTKEIKTYKCKYWGVSIISSRLFCEKMAERFREHTGVAFKFSDDKRHPGICSIRITSNKRNLDDFKKIYNFLYSDSKLFLTRKKQKFNLIFNEI